MKKGEEPVKRIQKRESHEKSSSSSSSEPVQVVPLPSWEDMFPQGLEMMRHIEQKKKNDYPSNPYRYNLRGSSPKPPLGLSPLKPKKVQPDEIEEKIIKLEQVSKACVETIGEGVDAYWMMSKDLEKRVDDIDSRVEFLVKIVLEMADDKKKLLRVVEEQQADIAELSARFACIAHACNLKNEKKEDVFFTPEKN
jgi:hypothetical protein